MDRQARLKTIEHQALGLIIGRMEKAKAERGRPAVGSSDCCIFGAPESLALIQPNSFKPQFASIGPMHCDVTKTDVEKLRYLRSLLERMPSLEIDGYVKAVSPLLEMAKACYLENRKTDEWLLAWMIIDGCFILEILRRVRGAVPIDRDDPIFSKPWMVPSIMIDMIKLGNQIPFFVLEKLYNFTRAREEQSVSLANLVSPFFDTVMLRPRENEHMTPGDAKHLLDFLHSSFLPSSPQILQRPSNSQTLHNPKTWTELIPSAVRLRAAGITFKPSKNIRNNFFDIKFKNGVVEIPPITINDSTLAFLINCIAYEECQLHCTKHFSAYAVFMSLLISSARDVILLCESRIIDNRYGAEEEVARFFNTVGKAITTKIWETHLCDELEKINQYYENNWNVIRTSFMDTYFSTPWSLISTIAAVVLLLLTFLQTLYSILSYYKSSS